VNGQVNWSPQVDAFSEMVDKIDTCLNTLIWLSDSAVENMRVLHMGT
jgi:hypothetical protein